jgi:hypothetical protein
MYTKCALGVFSGFWGGWFAAQVGLFTTLCKVCKKCTLGCVRVCFRGSRLRGCVGVFTWVKFVYTNVLLGVRGEFETGFYQRGVTFRDRTCHRVRGFGQFWWLIAGVCRGCVHKLGVCFHTCIRGVCGAFRGGQYSGHLYTQCTKVIGGVCGCVWGFSMGQSYTGVVHALYTCEIRGVRVENRGFLSSRGRDCYIFGFFSGFPPDGGMGGGY